MRTLRMKPMLCCGVVFISVCLLTVPYAAEAQTLSPSDQLTNQDLSKIFALLQGQNAGIQSPSASAPVPAISPLQTNGASNSNAPSPEDLVQSLSLVNSLLSAGGLSPDIASLLGGAVAVPTAATTTTTTTENPKVNEEQVAQLLSTLLAGNDGNAGASSNAGLAALLGLAAAAGNQQQQPQQQQPVQQQSSLDAQTALFTNLLLSSAGVNPQQTVKQQDFSTFQNAGPALDQASSNQLNQLGGVLSLLGTLGSLSGGQTNPLAGLLGGGGGGQANLLSGLLGLGGTQQQSRRPGLLSTLGNLASVVGGAIRGPQDGQPKLRGVDTRLGLGYRFGENADAQVVFEIGPQLFTEPLTDEQKRQLLLQQQQQQLLELQRQQQLQQRKNPNRRLQVIRKHQLPNRIPVRMGQTGVLRRYLPVTNEHNFAHSQQSHSAFDQNQRPGGLTGGASPSRSTLHHMMQPPIGYHTRNRQHEFMTNHNTNNHYLNYYAKEEANPKSNKHSRLTEYEIWLLSNRNGNNGNNLPIPLNSHHSPQRKDMFTFSKDNSNNIVRVRVQPRQTPRHVQVIHTMGDGSVISSRHQISSNTLQNRMGFYDYSAADDSYAKRNAAVVNPLIRDWERQRERQQYVNPQLMHQRRRNSQPQLQADKRSVMQTLTEWNEKNSFLDLMQNYVVEKIRSEGNNIVKSVFTSDKQQNQAQKPAALVATKDESPGLMSSIKGLLGMTNDNTDTPKTTTPKPVIRVGDHVSYSELASIMNGNNRAPEATTTRHNMIPAFNDASAFSDFKPFPSQSPAPEIFIDISNGEVSMRKAFGSMESFTPPTPEPLPPDSPKHVYNVLKEQLKREYERIKLEQMKEAAKQIRKENIANGLSNPTDPLYMASNFFDLVEKEQIQRRSSTL